MISIQLFILFIVYIYIIIIFHSLSFSFLCLVLAYICPPILFLQCLCTSTLQCSAATRLEVDPLSPRLTSQFIHFIFTTKLMRSLLHTLAVLGPFRLLFPPFSFFVFKLSHILTHLPSPFQFHNSSLSFSMFLLLPLSVDVHESPP